MNNLAFLISGFLISTSLWASVQSYKLTLKSYPKENADCHEVARDVAQRFEKASGITVSDSACLAESEHGFDIELGYTAEQPAQIVSTRYVFAGVYPIGRYSDRKTCEQRLPIQVAVFEDATALKAIYQYCERSRYQDVAPWSPTLIGIGNAKREPQIGGYYLFSNPKDLNGETFLFGLRNALEKHDAILSDVIIHPALASATASIHYFSKERLNFELHEVTKNKKAEECEANRKEATAFLAKTANPPFTLYCGYIGIFGQWELNMGFVEDPSFKWRPSLENFANLEACEEKRLSLVAKYASHESKILGGLCTQLPEDRRFFVMLFKDK